MNYADQSDFSREDAELERDQERQAKRARELSDEICDEWQVNRAIVRTNEIARRMGVKLPEVK